MVDGEDRYEAVGNKRWWIEVYLNEEAFMIHDTHPKRKCFEAASIESQRSYTKAVLN